MSMMNDELENRANRRAAEKRRPKHWLRKLALIALGLLACYGLWKIYG